MIELDELQNAAQKAFPADKLSPSRDESWKLAAEMGWLMIRLPEDMGGLGLGREASTMLHFEMGRVLSSAPLMPAQLGLHALVSGADFDGREDWLERVAGGDYVPLHNLPSRIETATGGALSGSVSGVFEADMASGFVVHTGTGYALLDAQDPGVSFNERPIWDPSRRLFDLALDGAQPVAMLAEGPEAAKALHDVIAPDSHLAVAADSLGGATGSLAASVDYMQMRKQFGRPIGMFQALKHRAADCRIKITAGEALLWSRARQEDATQTQYGVMKAHATEVFQWVTEEMIQFHGGIGLTEEHHCHLFMKRAMLNRQLGANPEFWFARAGREAVAEMA